MTFADIVKALNDIAWGPWMLILLVGTGVYYSIRLGFLQFGKFGYAMKNTIGKVQPMHPHNQLSHHYNSQ